MHVNGPGTTLEVFQSLIDPDESLDPLVIWPKVKTLHWMTPPDHLPFLKHFLTVNIHNLKIELEGAGDEEVQEVLGLVESRCMNLVDLHFFDPETRENEEIQDTLRQIVYNNSLTLRRLFPPQDPSPSLVNDILSLPMLEVLEMHTPQIPYPASDGILPALECLTFTLDEVPDIIELLGTLRKSKLAVFSLTCPYPTSEDEHAAIAGFFEDSGFSATMEQFYWEAYHDGGAPTWPFVTTLKSFANMQVLFLRAFCCSGCSFRFRHKDIVEISKWMPLLKELNLGGSPCDAANRITDIGYHTLAALAKNCRNLFMLTIHFSTRFFGFVPREFAEPNWNVALWDVGSVAPPSNPEAITMFALAVSKLFPRVAFKGEKIKYAREWDVIHEELQMLTLPANHGLQSLM